MARSILDTNRLCDHWRIMPRPQTGNEARQRARMLIQDRKTDAIVTPVRIEFLAGARSKDELALFAAFLDELDVVDRGRIVDEDWRVAENRAKHVRADGKPRQLGDCLIRAIAERLRFEVDTRDRAFPQ
jgi:predicted nucleic acid-binding protein